MNILSFRLSLSSLVACSMFGFGLECEDDDSCLTLRFRTSSLGWFVAGGVRHEAGLLLLLCAGAGLVLKSSGCSPERDAVLLTFLLPP